MRADDGPQDKGAETPSDVSRPKVLLTLGGWLVLLSCIGFPAVAQDQTPPVQLGKVTFFRNNSRALRSLGLV
jgi:hypothetical protein